MCSNKPVTVLETHAQNHVFKHTRTVQGQRTPRHITPTLTWECESFCESRPSPNVLLNSHKFPKWKKTQGSEGMKPKISVGFFALPAKCWSFSYRDTYKQGKERERQLCSTLSSQTMKQEGAGASQTTFQVVSDDVTSEEGRRRKEEGQGNLNKPACAPNQVHLFFALLLKHMHFFHSFAFLLSHRDFPSVWHSVHTHTLFCGLLFTFQHNLKIN